MDIALAIVQLLTLIVLAFYAIQTWRTVREMKESRAQEIAPYVIAYFDVPYGKAQIFVVVKNIGKGVARDVRLNFDPPLRNSDSVNVNDIGFIKNGIRSMPPGYEIRTFFDGMREYFKTQELPLLYRAEISYSGGLFEGIRTEEYEMDLSAFKKRFFVEEKGLHELVKQFEKLNSTIENKIEELIKLARAKNKRSSGKASDADYLEVGTRDSD